jgi:hypothetical protein
MRAIVLVFSCAALSLTLTAAVSRPAPQAEEQRPVTPKQSNSDAEVKEMTTTKKIATGPEPESFEGSQRGFNALGKRFLVDQGQIWTSPAKIRFSDTQWLVPLSGITAGLFVTDSDFSSHLSHNPATISHYKTLSNAGVGALIGGAGGMWLLGHVSHNEHWSETGFLAGEAALNSLVVVEGFKYSLGRERPFQGNGSGNFFQGGTSFPSEHAAAAWSVAGVIAHEYPGFLTKLAVYGLAATVSFSRVRGQQHFPSDVLVGTVIGNLIAQNIYSRHHDPELGGEAWRSISEMVGREWNVSPSSSGTTFVPNGSWVYPALDRLAALGYIKTQFLGMRPWTRLECAGLVQSADDVIGDSGADLARPGSMIQELESEFASEFDVLGGGSNRRMRLESVYTRMMGITGKPLADSYHFGQTIINDYGRPFEEGFNNSTGFSGYATAGRYSVYVRGEYQRAPSAPAYSLPVRQAIAVADANPLLPAQPVAGVDQYRLLDTYVGVNLEGWQMTFGKQSLWWGPGEGGALLFSNNAEPIYMFRASRVTPFTLPWVFHWLGPMKWDVFFGKLSGNQFPPRPVIHGEKISFKPTENLELGFSRTVELGGVGRPLTLGAIWHSYVSVTSSASETPATDPGKRTGGFEFSYRVPLMRNWLTVFGDSLADDDPSPLAAPRRAGINLGLYMPRLPGLPKLDLRVEAVNTDASTPRSNGGKYIYWDSFYHDLYTNKKNIIGSWIGREGVGYQAWSTYWFSPHNSLQFGYRHAMVASDFIPGGESVNDGSMKLSWWIRRDLSVSTFVQYEKWKAPLLAPSPQSNWTSSIEISLQPQGLFRRYSAGTVDGARSPSGNGAQP